MLLGADLLFAALFALSVVVQVNDPDPIPWMLVYGAAFGVCIGWWRGRRVRGVAACVGALAFGWSLLIAVDLRLGVPLTVALSDWQMHSAGSEEAREIGGLWLVSAWMTVLAVCPRPIRDRATN